MNLLSKYQLYLPFLIMLGSLNISAQTRTIIYADKSNNFFVEAYISGEKISGNCIEPFQLHFVTKGVCPDNLVLSWDVTFYDCNLVEKLLPIKLNIRKKQSSYKHSISITATKLKYIIAANVSSRFVNPPSFTITGEETILEGDKTILRISSSETPGTKWYWYKSNSNKSIGEGRTITVDPVTTTTYFAKAETDGFLSAPKSFTINVKLKPAPPNDFQIAGPNQVKEGYDAKLVIKGGDDPPGVRWNWYREGEERAFTSGKEIIVSPITTTKFLVQGELNGKKSPLRSYQLFVEKTPEPPQDFIIIGPDKVMEGSEAVLQINAKTEPDSLRWFWYRNGEKESFAEGKIISIVATEKITFHARSGLYKKISPQKSFSLNVIIKSKQPEVIGNLKICKGDQAKQSYSATGGTLGTGSVQWEWFEGKCGSGKFIGSGNSVEINLTGKNTSYYVRPNADSSVCKEFTIEYFEYSRLPEKILAGNNICHGTPFKLEIMGGKLANNSKWVWYAQSHGSSRRQKIGEGSSITTAADVTTRYFVKSENGICDPTGEVSVLVNIIGKATTRSYIISTRLNSKKYNLKTTGIPTEGGFKPVWYLGGCGAGKIGVGEEINFRIKGKESHIYMRLEGKCDTLICDNTYLRKQIKSKQKFIFFNSGVSTHDFSDFSNGYFAIGSNLLYARIKYNFKEIENLFNSQGNSPPPEYECDNNYSVINYPSNNTYYLFNDEIEDKRRGYTIGIMTGGKTAKIFFGGGYGKRDLILGLDIHQRISNQYLRSTRAKNVDESISGLELETGFFFNFPGLNFMAGASMIYATAEKRKYFDFQAGIGISFNSR